MSLHVGLNHNITPDSSKSNLLNLTPNQDEVPNRYRDWALYPDHSCAGCPNHQCTKRMLSVTTFWHKVDMYLQLPTEVLQQAGTLDERVRTTK